MNDTCRLRTSDHGQGNSHDTTLSRSFVQKDLCLSCCWCRLRITGGLGSRLEDVLEGTSHLTACLQDLLNLRVRSEGLVEGEHVRKGRQDLRLQAFQHVEPREELAFANSET